MNIPKEFTENLLFNYFSLLIGCNETDNRITLYGQRDALEKHGLYVTNIDSILTFPIGENLLRYISLTESDINLIKKLAGGSSKSKKINLNNWVDDLYSYIVYTGTDKRSLILGGIQDLNYIKDEFSFAVRFCCDVDMPGLNELTNLQRYYIYRIVYADNVMTANCFDFNTNSLYSVFEPEDIDEELAKVRSSVRDLARLQDTFSSPLMTDIEIPTKEIMKIRDTLVKRTMYYTCTSVSGYLSLEFQKMIEHDIRIKKCKNCNKYFIVKGAYATDYCDRIPEGETNTCKRIAAIKARREKVSSNPILKEYEKAYKRNYARRINRKMEEDQFTYWVDEAITKRDESINEYEANPSQEVIDDFKKYLGNK